MGSDEPYFGQDPELGNNPNFWANIHGYKRRHPVGRPVLSPVRGQQHGRWLYGSGLRPANDVRRHPLHGWIRVWHREGGQCRFAVTVEVFDAHFYRGGGDYFLVGDEHKSGGDGPTTVFQLYKPDPTPLDTSDNDVLVHHGIRPTRSATNTTRISTATATSGAMQVGVCGMPIPTMMCTPRRPDPIQLVTGTSTGATSLSTTRTTHGTSGACGTRCVEHRLPAGPASIRFGSSPSTTVNRA